MVNDVLERDAAPRRRASARVEDGARRRPAAGRLLRGAGGRGAALKAFLHARMYDAPPVKAVREEAQRDPRRPVRRLSRRSRAAAAGMAAGDGRTGAVAARDRRFHRRHDRPLCDRAATRSWSARSTCPKASDRRRPQLSAPRELVRFELTITFRSSTTLLSLPSVQVRALVAGIAHSRLTSVGRCPIIGHGEADPAHRRHRTGRRAARRASVRRSRY